MGTYLVSGEASDPLEALVNNFAKRLLAKLRLAQANGRSGWERDDWEKDCQQGLLHHVAKGDPRDVAAYCAFMDYHGWITVSQAAGAAPGPSDAPTWPTEDQIWDCIRLTFDGRVARELSFKRWKDGIDVDYPNYEAVSFAKQLFAMGFVAAQADMTPAQVTPEPAQWQWRTDDGNWCPTEPPDAIELREKPDRFRPLYLSPFPVQPPWKMGDPPPHWTANDGWDRHPQSAQEWDVNNDPIGTRKERAIRRLNFAVDRDDPRAPAETAVVSRWDLSVMMGDLTHKRAAFEYRAQMDVTNHHNALLCPHCNPNSLKFEASPAPPSSDSRSER